MHEMGIMESAIEAVLAQARSHDAAQVHASCFESARSRVWNPKRSALPSAP